MKLIGGLYAITKGGKHDGHEVRIQEKGIYCLTCDKFYPRRPTTGAVDVCRATGGEHVWVTAADYGEVCGPCGTRR